jgi:hypothetical protein
MKIGFSAIGCIRGAIELTSLLRQMPIIFVIRDFQRRLLRTRSDNRRGRARCEGVERLREVPGFVSVNNDKSIVERARRGHLRRACHGWDSRSWLLLFWRHNRVPNLIDLIFGHFDRRTPIGICDCAGREDQITLMIT